jgi:malonyl-CoA O-methyltransferase
LGGRYRAADVIAIDAALPMAAGCPRKLGLLRPLHRTCADARALPLADHSIDLVWSNLALYWLDEPIVAFNEIARVLSPEGVVLFTTFGPDTLTELRQSWASVDAGAHVNRFIDMHDLGDDLLRAGLREPVMDVQMLTLTYADPWQLMRELKGMGAHNVSSERRRGLTGKNRLRKMTRTYVDGFGCDGRIPASWEVVFGLAWGAAAGQARAHDGGQIATFPVDQLRGSRPPDRS